MHDSTRVDSIRSVARRYAGGNSFQADYVVDPSYKLQEAQQRAYDCFLSYLDHTPCGVMIIGLMVTRQRTAKLFIELMVVLPAAYGVLSAMLSAKAL